MAQFDARHVSESALSVIDISGLRSPDPAERRKVGDAMRHSCLDIGFMYIVGHGVPRERRDAVFAQAARFFSKPEDEKLALHMKQSSGNNGYEPLRYQLLEPGTPPDLKEGFYIGEELPDDHPHLVTGKFNFGPNQWPDDLPEFRAAMMAYYDDMLGLGALIMRGMALSLDLPEDYFEPFCTDPLTGLRLLHYPPQPPNPQPGEKGCGAHTDFGGFTILMQDDNGGLQVLGHDGEWIHATPIPDSYIVNLGDLMGRWTNDHYQSTVHRVVNVSGKERYSVPFFYSGNPDQDITAIPTCVEADDAPKYPSTTVDAHLREMYAKTYVPA